MDVDKDLKRRIRIVSLQAPNCEKLPENVALLLNECLPDHEVYHVNGVPFEECRSLLDASEAQIGWLCGTCYVWRKDDVELIGAHIMKDERYQKRPVYFSDVYVHKSSRFHSWEDLRGCKWCYNEPDSFSGYWVVWNHLYELNVEADYFGTVIEAGSHENAIKLLMKGDADAGAIDSTVFEQECVRNPALRDEFRLIRTLGPNPMPPFVIRSELPEETKAAVKKALLNLHNSEKGRKMLDEMHVDRFVEVDEEYYSTIRRAWERGKEHLSKSTKLIKSISP